jgi:hypothetical protein
MGFERGQAGVKLVGHHEASPHQDPVYTAMRLDILKLGYQRFSVIFIGIHQPAKVRGVVPALFFKKSRKGADHWRFVTVMWALCRSKINQSLLKPFFV